MPCEHHKNALIEAAASGAAPPRELRAHLETCPSCRSAFAEEQSFLVAIDSGLHAGVNAEIPPSLLPRVRARLDEVAAPRLRWVQPLAFGSASVALALVVFLLARPHHAAPEEAGKPDPAVVEAPAAAAPKTSPERISSEGTQLAAVRVGDSRASRKSTNPHSVTSGNPEVLVPPGTEAAFLKNLPSLLKEFKPSQQWGGQGKALEIEPLVIEEMSSAPLSPDESDSGPNGGVGQLRPLPVPAGFLSAGRH